MGSTIQFGKSQAYELHSIGIDENGEGTNTGCMVIEYASKGRIRRPLGGRKVITLALPAGAIRSFVGEVVEWESFRGNVAVAKVCIWSAPYMPSPFGNIPVA